MVCVCLVSGACLVYWRWEGASAEHVAEGAAQDAIGLWGEGVKRARVVVEGVERAMRVSGEPLADV